MIEELQALGLSYYESKAFKTVLEQRCTAKELSREADIPMGKVYSVINGLVEDGLVKTTTSRPKRVYVPNASQAVDYLISQKQKEHEQLLSDVRRFAAKLDSAKKRKSKFLDIGVAQDELERVQSRTFIEAEDEVLQVFNPSHNPGLNREKKLRWEEEIIAATNRGVQFNAIYPPQVELPDLLQELQEEHPDRFAVKRLHTTFPRCDIIDEKKVLVKLYEGDPASFGGVLFLTNEQLATSLKDTFTTFWNEAAAMQEH